MSHGTTETVKIEDGNGSFVVINASDFDAKKHVKHGEKKQRKVKQAAS